ncbi:Glycosaminoglycan xylosylkinase [Mactra antiquata]
MKKKHGHLLKVILVMGLILFIGYKILLPEIKGDNIYENEKEEVKRLRNKQDLVKINKNKLLKSTMSMNKSINHLRGAKIYKQDVIDELKNTYRINWNYKLKESPWNIAANWFSSEHVFPENTPELELRKGRATEKRVVYISGFWLGGDKRQGAVLREMATRRIIAAYNGKSGSQLKMTLKLEGGQTVAFKPQWYPRDKIIDGVIYSGADRHNGEIAAFHLSRLLDIRRTFLSVGRVVDMETDIRPVADPSLLDTFFYKNTSTCFYGKCYYCKGEETGVCADGTKLEGTLILWLPLQALPLKKIRHPWARNYKSPTALAKWQTNKDYCMDTVLVQGQFKTGRLLLDVIDSSILDYLISNGDRHQLEYSTKIYDNPFMLALDHGKSFGNPYHDEKSILAPLFQCCRIRESTWLRLLMFDDGILSEVLEDVLSSDPIAPVLNKLHLNSLDRRLKNVLNTIRLCIAKFNVEKVLIKNR